MQLMSEPVIPPGHAIFVREFEPSELATLRRAWIGTREIARHEPLIGSRESGRVLVSISHGWAGRIMEGGDHRRQILDLLMRGDLCGLDAMIAGTRSDDICALTAVTVECFDAAAVNGLLAEHPALSRALLRHSILQNGASRAGQRRMRVRGAERRMTALIHDLVLRLTQQATEDRVEPSIPLTQTDLADATGLTAIHVNRVIAKLRSTGIIGGDNRELQVRNWPALREAAGL